MTTRAAVLPGALAAALAALAAACFLPAKPPPSRALWPGARYTVQNRDGAVRRGLQFIHRVAMDPRHFKENGTDLLRCFYTISSTSADPQLRDLAWRIGRERALAHRRGYPSVPAGASARAIYSSIEAGYATQSFGLPDDRMKADLRRLAAALPPESFFRFDPNREPPPADLPEDCDNCRTRNPRGTRLCRKCGAPLEMTSRYDLMCDAIITAYIADRYGVSVGVRFTDLLPWLPSLRPYRGPENGRNADFEPTVYMITHLVYALNDYSVYRLRPEWLPDEFEFLKSHAGHFIGARDPETLGEFLDTLKSFGLTEADPLIRNGVEFLLSRQNPDGSWGDPKDPDIYNRYHTTWTAVDGLRDYAWRRGTGVTFPAALARLR